MTARGALRELKTVTEGLSYPIVTSKPTWHDSDRAAVAAWKKYLKYEEGNPLVYSEPSALSGRISYALRKCLTYMRFFPELW
jgi:cleavage stimulation factor subunit 3